MIKTCQCGNILNDSTIPNSIVFRVYSYPYEWEIKKNRYLNIAYKRECSIGKIVWYCPQCHCIHTMFNIGNTFKTFALSKKIKKDSFDDICNKCGNKKNTFLAVNDSQNGNNATIFLNEGIYTKNFQAYRVLYCSHCNIIEVSHPKSTETLIYSIKT